MWRGPHRSVTRSGEGFMKCFVPASRRLEYCESRPSGTEHRRPIAWPQRSDLSSCFEAHWRQSRSDARRNQLVLRRLAALNQRNSVARSRRADKGSGTDYPLFTSFPLIVIRTGWPNHARGPSVSYCSLRTCSTSCIVPSAGTHPPSMSGKSTTQLAHFFPS